MLGERDATRLLVFGSALPRRIPVVSGPVGIFGIMTMPEDEKQEVPAGPDGNGAARISGTKGKKD